MRVQDLEARARIASNQLAATEGRLSAAEAQLAQRDSTISKLRADLAEGEAAREALLRENRDQRGAHDDALRAAEARHDAHEHRRLVGLNVERMNVKQLHADLDQQCASAAKDAKAATDAIEGRNVAVVAAQQALAREQLRGERLVTDADGLKAALQEKQTEVDVARSAQRDADLTTASLRATVKLLQLQADATHRQVAELAAQNGAKDVQIAALLSVAGPGLPWPDHAPPKVSRTSGWRSGVLSPWLPQPAPSRAWTIGVHRTACPSNGPILHRRAGRPTAAA